MSIKTETVKLVSIPFKREGVSKGSWLRLCKSERDEVSIPFKREGVYKEEQRFVVEVIRGNKFQFPSNGKVYTKKNGHLNFRVVGGKVFQFPSNGKVYTKDFNFFTQLMTEILFQFPSNGKVYPKVCSRYLGMKKVDGFNSLQTGRCIQRNTELLRE